MGKELNKFMNVVEELWKDKYLYKIFHIIKERKLITIHEIGKEIGKYDSFVIHKIRDLKKGRIVEYDTLQYKITKYGRLVYEILEEIKELRKGCELDD